MNKFTVSACYPEGNIEIPLNVKKFSGGEVQVTLDFANLKLPQQFLVEAHIRDSDGTMILAQIKEVLDCGQFNLPIILHLPYVPYARQDRRMVTGDARSLNIWMKWLNAMNFTKVWIADPHSDVTTALIERGFVIPQETVAKVQLAKLNPDFKYDAIVSPDGGALKKIYKVAKELGVERVLQASKERNVLDGSITNTTIPRHVRGLDLLISDDLCEGGYTFTTLAKLLKEQGARRVDLFVTHGIFSKGVDILSEYIDNIYCGYVWEENTQGRNNNGTLKGDYN